MASLAPQERNPKLLNLLADYTIATDEAQVDSTNVLQMINSISNLDKVAENQFVGPLVCHFAPKLIKFIVWYFI